MTKRTALLAVLCFLLCLPLLAVGEDDSAFVSPTRDPSAPDYDRKSPGLLVPEQIVARSYILIERSSREVLDYRDPDVQLFPASTTKVMTALIALQMYDLENPDMIRITETMLDLPDDAERVPFRLNEEVSFRDVMYGLMLKSGNEAANAIAEYISGNNTTFVYQMNQTAKMLGCTNTNFVNPHGLHDDAHQTTARDLAIIMDAALDNEDFRQIIGTYTWDLSQTRENPARKIYNTNLHLNPDPENNYYYPTSEGGKTGFTNPAGYVIVEAAERDGVELICVVMYSGKYSRWRDTEWLFEYGFSKYKSITAEEIYQQDPTVLRISGFDTSDPGKGDLELSIRPVDTSRTVRFVGQTADIDQIVENYSNYTNISYVTEPRAPVTAGQVMAILTFYPPNEEPAEYELLASRNVAARAEIPPTLEEIEARVLADPSPFPPFSWDWVLPPLLIAAAVIYLLRLLIRLLWRRRRKKKSIPKPKGRTFT